MEINIAANEAFKYKQKYWWNYRYRHHVTRTYTTHGISKVEKEVYRAPPP